MADYRRLISYIYSYEKGVKTKNSGFAKIESRNGICKLNISLRISDILLNEAEDNSLEVFLFYRNEEKIEKILIGRIRISSGSSEFKIQMNSERIGSQGIPLTRITGIFICSQAFLHKNSRANLIYASEWDDIPIEVSEFADKNDLNDNKVLQDNREMDYNKENSDTYEQSEIRASEVIETTHSNGAFAEDLPEETRFQNVQPNRNETAREEDFIKETEREEQEVRSGTQETMFAMQPEAAEEKTADETEPADENSRVEENEEIEEMPDCEACKKQLEAMLSEQLNDSKKMPDTGDYFKMLCNCYPKIKINEIDGECIKITPHDISYLPKRYWHLCNNSFLLHGFYNYKYLILCEKTIDNVRRHMICVPGVFHNKEQTMAKMFGFTEFQGGQQNGMMKFGYWCMYL